MKKIKLYKKLFIIIVIIAFTYSCGSIDMKNPVKQSVKYEDTTACFLSLVEIKDSNFVQCLDQLIQHLNSCVDTAKYSTSVYKISLFPKMENGLCKIDIGFNSHRSFIMSNENLYVAFQYRGFEFVLPNINDQCFKDIFMVSDQYLRFEYCNYFDVTNFDLGSIVFINGNMEFKSNCELDNTYVR